MRSRQVSICTELKYSVTCCDQGSSEFGLVQFGKCKGMQKFEGPVRKSDLWYLFESSSKKKSVIQQTF